MQAGDITLEVDGEDVSGLRLDEVQGRLLRPVGIPVTIEVLVAESGDTVLVTLERAEVKLDLAHWYRAPDSSTAYLRISAFS